MRSRRRGSSGTGDEYYDSYSDNYSPHGRMQPGKKKGQDVGGQGDDLAELFPDGQLSYIEES
jgi:hypothetical protein